VGIAEEEHEERGERDEEHRGNPSDRDSRHEREHERAADEGQPRGIETHDVKVTSESVGRAGGRARRSIGPLSVRVFLAVPAQDVFHPVFQLQLAFFEGDFFDLFWF